MDPADPAGAAVLDAARAIAAGDLGDAGTPPALHPAELGAAGFVCLEPDGETRAGGATAGGVHRSLVRVHLAPARGCPAELRRAVRQRRRLDPEDAGAPRC